MAFWNDPSSIVPKKQSAWVVFFGKRTLDKSGQTKSFGEDRGSYSTNQLFVGFFKTVSKPSYQLKTTQHKYLGIHEFHYPTHVVWQPIKLTLIDGYIYDLGGNYIRNDEILWENGSLKFAKRQLVKRSAQTFFYDALREGGYTDPEEFDVDDKLARFRRTVFKNDLIGATVGQNLDFDSNNNVDTRSWNTLDIVEYAPVLNGYKNIETIKQELTNITNVNGLSEQLSGLTKEKKLEALNDIQNSYNKERNLIYKSIQNNNTSNVKEMERWELYNPIITDVNFGELNYEQDALTNITLTVAYDWAKLTVSGDSIDSDEEVKEKVTKDINIKTSLGNVTATVRRSDIDEQLAKEIASGRSIPTINDPTLQQIERKVKEADIYKTDATAIELDNTDTKLRNSLDTTEKQIREEFADVDQVVKDTGEVRRAVADILVARNIALSGDVSEGDILKIVQDRIADDSSLTDIEKQTALGYFNNTNGLINDSEYLKAIQYDQAKRTDVLNGANEGKRISSNDSDNVFSKARERIIDDNTLSATARVAALASYDKERAEVVTTKALEALDNIQFDPKSNEQSLDLLKEQIVKLYGEQGLDVSKLEQKLKTIADTKFATTATKITDIDDRLSAISREFVDAGDDPAKYLPLEKEKARLQAERNELVKSVKQYGINETFENKPILPRPIPTQQDDILEQYDFLAKGTPKKETSSRGFEQKYQQTSESVSGIDGIIEDARSRVILAIPSYKNTEQQEAQIKEYDKSIKAAREYLLNLPDNSNLTDQQAAKRSQEIRSLAANVTRLYEERARLEKQYQIDTKYNDDAEKKYEDYYKKQQEIIEKAKSTREKQLERLKALDAERRKGNR